MRIGVLPIFNFDRRVGERVIVIIIFVGVAAFASVALLSRVVVNLGVCALDVWLSEF